MLRIPNIPATWRLVVSQERRTPTESSLFINSATDPTTCRFPNQIRCHKEDSDAQGMSTILDPLTIYLHFFRLLIMFSIRNLVTWFEHLSPVRRMTRTDQVSMQGTREPDSSICSNSSNSSIWPTGMSLQDRVADCSYISARGAPYANIYIIY